MLQSAQLTAWQRWLRQPQKVWLRRALFQVHLWSGIVVGLYILMISITGSVLVYWNELYRAVSPQPILSTASTPRLTNEQLSDSARSAYPSYRVVRLARASNPEQAVEVHLAYGNNTKKRLFDPRTGRDLGDAVPVSMRLVSWVQDLHDNLLAGPTGRKVNGIGAVAVLVLAASGLTIWWPGIKTWRRSLTLPPGVGWRRSIWHLHSAIGFWSLAFTIIFGFSGIYLAIPERIQDFADWIQPPTAANAGRRAVDSIIYWLAYLHFGRIQGIGIPCRGPGVCDQATKAVWALFGLAPAVMVVTGAIMWWNRVLRVQWTRRRFER